MAERRLLFALAHPDDESFGYGGVIARYVAEGVDVYLICSTNGDAGTVAEEFLNGYDSVAALRLAELDCAAAKLGVKQVFKLGYKDSGMMHSETSRDPACSWQAPPEEMARRVVEVIRQVRPQVIVTFNKYGGYGHPDHIAIQRATALAFSLAGDPTYITPGLEPYQPQKLYHSSIPTLMLRLTIARLRLASKDPRRVGRNADIDLVAILDHVEPTTTLVNVGDYLEDWDAASACHASQLGGGFVRLPLFVRRLFAARQAFTRVHPPPARPRVDEHDLFAGVALDASQQVLHGREQP
ncbi:MAG: PIG-L family deacetylase [Aggregatilineales bacterium]